MHRAAFPFGATGGFAVKLGDHAIQIAALGKVVGMPAIGHKHHIFRPKRLAYSYSDGLLADRQMARAFDLIGGVNPSDLLFDTAYAIERAIETHQHL